MKHLTAYKLFESNSDSELERFTNEATDCLRDLTDTNNYRVETSSFHPIDGYIPLECIYVCKIIGENYIILWKNIKDDVGRFIDMSEFKLKNIKVSPIRYGDSFVIKSISRIPDSEELSHVQLYFTKK